MDKELREVMGPLTEPLLAKRVPEVMRRAFIKLDYSITRTAEMMKGRKGRTGPVGDSVKCARMKDIVLGKEVEGATPVEYSFVKTKWAEAVKDMLEEEAI